MSAKKNSTLDSAKAFLRGHGVSVYFNVIRGNKRRRFQCEKNSCFLSVAKHILRTIETRAGFASMNPAPVVELVVCGIPQKMGEQLEECQPIWGSIFSCTPVVQGVYCGTIDIAHDDYLQKDGKNLKMTLQIRVDMRRTRAKSLDYSFRAIYSVVVLEICALTARHVANIATENFVLSEGKP